MIAVPTKFISADGLDKIEIYAYENGRPREIWVRPMIAQLRIFHSNPMELVEDPIVQERVYKFDGVEYTKDGERMFVYREQLCDGKK